MGVMSQAHPHKMKHMCQLTTTVPFFLQPGMVVSTRVATVHALSLCNVLSCGHPSLASLT